MGTLRLLLAFAVVVSHTRPVFGFVGIGGSPAVMAFFIISGFYMHLVLDTRYRDQAGLFYLNRALRLLPAYWATLLIIVLIAISGVVRFDGGYSKHTLARVLDGSVLARISYLPNLFIVGADVFRQIGTSPQTGEIVAFTKALVDSTTITSAVYYLLIPQIWSVSNEAVFYAVAPVVVRLKGWYFIGLLAFAYVLWGMSRQADLKWLYIVPNFNFVFFLFGMAAYRWSALLKKCPLPLLACLSAAPFAYFLANGLLTTESPAWVWIPFAIGVPALFELSKHNRIDRLVGDLSYPVYLVHFIFANSERGALPVFAASVLVGCLMLIFVEWPVERLRHFIVQRRLAFQHLPADARVDAPAIAGPLAD